MASLYEALAGGMGTEQQYQAQDPYMNAGVNILKAQTPTPTSNSQAILLPLLQGLAGGTLMGYGKANANQTAFNDYSQNALLKNLSAPGNIGPLASGDTYGNMIENPQDFVTHPYASGVMPEDWTAKQGAADITLATIQRQAAMDEMQKRKDAQAKILESVLTEGVKNESLSPTQAIAYSGLPADKLATALSGNESLSTGGTKSAKKLKDLEDTAYKRITDLPEYKQISDISPNFKALVDLAKQDEKAADIGFFTTIARIRDPNSTVREGEYKINSDTQSYLDNLYGDWRSAITGKSKLSVATKVKILESVMPKYNQTAGAYSDAKERILADLESQGGSRARVPVMDYKPYSPEPQYEERMLNGQKVRVLLGK